MLALTGWGWQEKLEPALVDHPSLKQQMFHLVKEPAFVSIHKDVLFVNETKLLTESGFDNAASALLYNYYLYVPKPSRNLGCIKCDGCQIRLTRTDLCLKHATSNKQKHPQSQPLIRCGPGYRWLLIENQSIGKTLGF